MKKALSIFAAGILGGALAILADTIYVDGGTGIAPGGAAPSVASGVAPPPPAGDTNMLLYFDFNSDTNALGQYTNQAVDYAKWYFAPASGAAQPTWVDPGGGQSPFVSFDGGDKMTCLLNAAAGGEPLNVNQWSMCWWMRLDSIHTSDGWLGFFRWAGATKQWYAFSAIYSDRLLYQGGGAAVTNGDSVSGQYGMNGAITTNWLFLAMTYMAPTSWPASGAWEMNSNGLPQSITFENTTVTQGPYDAELWLGNRGDNSWLISGDIDEFRFWKGTNLSAAEFAAIYANESAAHLPQRQPQ